MEKERKLISSDIDNLIALCHILNAYTEFTQNLPKLIKTKYNRDIVYNLYKISKGKLVVGSKKVKKFYQENKSVIDTINKFSNICIFINYNYDWQGNLSEESGLNFFYKYISTHQESLERILSVLEKIKKLGFDKLEFDEEIDFTNTKYKIDARLGGNFDIAYFDNIEVVPNYQKGVVEYRTTESNYKIIAKVSFGELSKYGKTIIVNSLLFDPKRLPEDVTKESIFDKIVSLKSNQQENCDTIRNSVDLSIGVDDLYSQFNTTSRIVDGLNNVECKEQLHEVLLGIKAYLDQLQTISSEYDDSISQSDSTITKEKLQKEKQLYLKRRYWASFDID